MATVTVKSTFPDGEVLLVQVAGKTSYPQALAELERTALDAYAEAFAMVRCAVDET